MGKKFVLEQIKVLKGTQCKYYVMFRAVVTKYIQLLARTNVNKIEFIVVIVESVDSGQCAIRDINQ